MDPQVLGSIVNAGSDVVSQGLNALGTAASNKQSREFAEKMYNRQRADSLADWTMLNSYNHPSEQMKRLKEANLNPALMYKGGATTEASPIRSSQAQSWKAEPLQFDLGSAARAGMAAYYDTQVKQAQVDNLRAQNDVLTQDALLKSQQILTSAQGREKTAKEIERLQTEIESGRYDYSMKQKYGEQIQAMSLEAATIAARRQQVGLESDMTAHEIQVATKATTIAQAVEAVLRSRAERETGVAARAKIYQEIKNLEKDYQLKEADYGLKKDGIQPGDPAWLRWIQQWFNNNSDREPAIKINKGHGRAAAPFHTNRGAGGKW